MAPHEVEALPTTVAARARFERERERDIARRMRRSVIEEIRQAQLTPMEVRQLREMLHTLRG